MDELIKVLAKDKAALSIAASVLIGILAWLVKSLIETPLNNSKEAFYNVLNKRVEIMAQLRSHLTLIFFFPGKDSFKNDLQKLLLDGNIAYIDSELLQSIFNVTFSQHTNLKEVRKLIDQINEDLQKWVAIAQDDITFYKKYNSPNPLKRTFALFALSFWNLVFLIFYISLILFLIYIIFFSNYKLWGIMGLGIALLGYSMLPQKIKAKLI